MDHITRVRTMAHAFAKGLNVSVSDDMSAAVGRLSSLCGPIEVYSPPRRLIPLETFTAELCYCAINFCYWEGRCDNRPAGGSVEAREMVFYYFELPPFPPKHDHRGPNRPHAEIRQFVLRTAEAFRDSSFPLSAERAMLIREIGERLDVVEELWRRCQNGLTSSEYDLTLLLSAFPGFATDPFLKRALFFFCILERVYGLGIDAAKRMPLPADYQIPKVLRGAGALNYSDHLSEIIESESLLMSGGVEETEIRAGAIVAVQRIADILNCSESMVDEWLWCSRNKVPGKYHLCRSTHY